jgi:hypothetical protein
LRYFAAPQYLVAPGGIADKDWRKGCFDCAANDPSATLAVHCAIVLMPG